MCSTKMRRILCVSVPPRPLTAARRFTCPRAADTEALSTSILSQSCAVVSDNTLGCIDVEEWMIVCSSPWNGTGMGAEMVPFKGRANWFIWKWLAFSTSIIDPSRTSPSLVLFLSVPPWVHEKARSLQEDFFSPRLMLLSLSSNQASKIVDLLTRTNDDLSDRWHGP